jgi:TRAP-type C4-dicarboxylate transport system substrate-binding protein
MKTRSADRNVWTRRRLLGGAASGLAGILALGRAPAFSQTAPKKLVMAHIVAAPESSAVAFAEMADAVNKQAGSGLDIEFHAGTLLTKELEVINAVKSGNIAIGDPGGAAATVFPEMGVFLVPYLVKSRPTGCSTGRSASASIGSFRTNIS